MSSSRCGGLIISLIAASAARHRVAIRAAALRHIRPSAATLATERITPASNHSTALFARGQIVGDADHDRGLAFVVDNKDTTTPEPSFFLPSSARLAGPLIDPGRRPAMTFTSPTLSHAIVAGGSAPPPPMASFFFASESSRSKRLRSSRSAATRAGTSSIGTRNSDARRLGEPCQIVGVGARRLRRQGLDAAHAGADRVSPITEIMPMSPVRLTWVPPHSSTDQPIVLPPPSPIATTRTSSPYFSPNSARAPEAIASSTAQQPGDHRRVLHHDVVGDILDALDLLGLIGFGCEKSKRRRSGATSEPFCAT